MEGVVALLDEPHTRLVERLWSDLAERFGVQPVAARPLPHLSLHVASRYDVPAVRRALRPLAATSAPVSVRATGLGVFAGPPAVIYVPVVRDRSLNDLHARLWPVVNPLAAAPSDYYAPDRWLPHLTLAFEPLPPAEVGRLVAHLLAQPPDWKIRLDRLAVIGPAAAGDRPPLPLRLTGTG